MSALLDLLGKLTPIADIGLGVLGVVIIGTGNAAETYGTVDLATISTIVGFFSMVAGGVGLLAALRKWFGVVFCMSIVQTVLSSAMLGVAVVTQIWALDDKAPIADAVDSNWDKGLRQQIALQGQVIPGYCNEWSNARPTCKRWYADVDAAVQTWGNGDEPRSSTPPTECPNSGTGLTTIVVAENCTLAYACGLDDRACQTCDVDCRYQFEQDMYDTIAGSAIMAITLWSFGAVMIFWGWYADSIQKASDLATEQLESDSHSADTKNKLEKARVEEHEITWQSKLSFFFHFLLFVAAWAVAGAGLLTFLSLSRDCEMVVLGADQDCGEWSFIAGGVIAALIGLTVVLSLYGVHIKYLAVTNCARVTISVLTLCYIPMGVRMMHSSGIVRDLGFVINDKWTTIYMELNAERFCDAPATIDTNDPCTKKLEIKVSENLEIIAGIYWILTLVMAGIVVINTLYARVLFAAHMDALQAGTSAGKAKPSDDGDRE